MHKQSGASGCLVLVAAVAGILEGRTLGVGAAVSLTGALAHLDGIQGAVSLIAGVMCAGLDRTCDVMIDMIH